MEFELGISSFRKTVDSDRFGVNFELAYPVSLCSVNIKDLAQSFQAFKDMRISL